MIMLNQEQVKRLHEQLLLATGGLDGIRDETLLDSALSTAFQTFGGVELYPSTLGKIARIAYSLIANHPFIDGNKRIGTYVLLVLLELNHFDVSLSDKDIVVIGLSIAEGKMDDKQLLEYLLQRM